MNLRSFKEKTHYKKNKINKKFWINYYEKRANQNSINNYKVNGFIDRILSEKINKVINNIIIKRGIKRLIDIGCGDGSCSSSLIKKNISVIGIDISPSMCKLATEKGLKTKCIDMIKLSKISLEDIGLNTRNNSVSNCLLFCESAYYQENPTETIEKICKINRKYYKNIVVSFANKYSILRKMSSIFQNNKINYFTQSELIRKLEKQKYFQYSTCYIVGIPFLHYRELNFRRFNNPIKKLLKILCYPFTLNIIIYFKNNSY